MSSSQILSVFGFLLIATTLEVSRDAIVRLAIYNHVGLLRLALMVIGAVLLFGYGFSLNLAPVEFRQVVGLYIATLFVVWQVINYVFLPNATDFANPSRRFARCCWRTNRYLLET